MSKQTGDADKILDQMDMQARLNGTPVSVKCSSGLKVTFIV